MERSRRVALTAATSGMATVVSMTVGLITVPLAVNYLGAERYGLWITVSSIFALLAFADLGIGNGLLNAIAESDGRDDREAARRSVSSAFFILLLASTVLAVAFGAAYQRIPWARAFNVTSLEATREAGPAAAVFVACVMLSIPLSMTQRVQMGYQEGFVNSMWQAGGSLLGFVGVIWAMRVRAGLPWLVAALAGGPVVASSLNGIHLFGFRRRWLLPRWKHTDWQAGRNIVSRGVLFFVLQLLGLFNYSSDAIIISHILGADQVAAYAVAARLFSVVPVALGMFIAPLWSAYGEAYARGDYAWVRHAYLRALKWSVYISGVGSVALVLWGHSVIRWWVGPKVAVPTLLLGGMGVANLANSFAGATAMLFNGLGILRFQVVVMACTATALLIAKMTLTREIGLPGIVWASILAQTVFSYIPSLIYIRRRLWPALRATQMTANVSC